MMYSNPLPEPKPVTDWKKLHRKIGQIIVLYPTESCIHEGNFMEQILFRTEKEMFILFERDIRNG